VKKVFLGGSRHVSRINTQVRERLDTIVDKNLPVLVGDANGADKAIQRHLHSREYSNVEVFCAGGVCRNNIGRWKVRSIPAESVERSFAFYAAKDRVMAHEASVGLMIWDGKSVGTLLNVFRLLADGKKAVIYEVPKKTFTDVTTLKSWSDFVKDLESGLRRKVEERAASENTPRKAPNQTELAV
jgi:hypothetical protein